MKAGYINTLIGATFSGGSNPTYALDNNSLKVTSLAAGNTLTITPLSGVLVDFLCLFNYDGTDVEIKVTQTGAGITTTALEAADAVGWAYNNYRIAVADNTDPITLITIENTGAATASLGYIYAGLWINFGCSENLQFFDDSNDDVTIDRVNGPTYDQGYKNQSVNYTTKKENVISTLRDKFRQILDTGYALKRPFLFDEPVFENDMFLGILGSGRVGYDSFQTDSEEPTVSQVTIEIREAF